MRRNKILSIKQKKRRKRRRLIWALLLILMLTAATIVGAMFAMRLNPLPKMKKNQAVLAITERENGSLVLAWVPVEGADSYDVLVANATEDGTPGETIFQLTAYDSKCALPELPLDQALHFEVSPNGGDKGKDGLISIDCFVTSPHSTKLERITDVENASVTLKWEMDEADDYQLYLMDAEGNLTPMDTPENGEKLIRFGENGDFAMPEPGAEPLMIVLEATRENENLIYNKRCSPFISIDRSSLMGTDPDLTYVDNEDNSYTLYWQETKGDGYEIQRWNTENNKWDTLKTYDVSDERVFETGHLAPNENYHYRVLVTGANMLPSVGMDETTDEVIIQTNTNVMYATIWPMKDLDITSSPGSSEVVGKAPQAQAFCVIGVAEGADFDRFLINTGTVTGYIDSRYCMINLPEYIGSLCSYDITNSYDSIFKVHEFGVNDITGTRLVGYENVLQENGTYLVPLLYPVAKKLQVAATQAMADGYRLKIYESYRPHETTTFIYNTTNAQINSPVATSTYDGRTIEEYLSEYGADIYSEKINGREVEATTAVDPTSDGQQAWARSYINQLTEVQGSEAAAEAANKWATGDYYLVVNNLPEGGYVDGKGYIHRADGSEVIGEDLYWTWAAFEMKEINKDVYTDAEGNEMGANSYGVVYNDFITRNGYHMGSFLAASGSRHNKGTALDLTIEDIKTGEELKMQTSMHDLSVYSVLSKNNEMAEKLKNIMTGAAGFKGIVSEWWHFQDDTINAQLTDLPYMEKGIDAHCLYTEDGKNFKERNADGTFG